MVFVEKMCKYLCSSMDAGRKGLCLQRLCGFVRTRWRFNHYGPHYTPRDGCGTPTDPSRFMVGCHIPIPHPPGFAQLNTTFQNTSQARLQLSSKTSNNGFQPSSTILTSLPSRKFPFYYFVKTINDLSLNFRLKDSKTANRNAVKKVINVWDVLVIFVGQLCEVVFSIQDISVSRCRSLSPLATYISWP